jgi:hypothetical protein
MPPRKTAKRKSNPLTDAAQLARRLRMTLHRIAHAPEGSGLGRRAFEAYERADALAHDLDVMRADAK